MATKCLAPGSLFVTANVTRVVDANPVYLEQAVPLNGSFGIYIFAGKPSKTLAALQHLSTNMSAAGSFFSRYSRTDMNRAPSSEKHNPHSHVFTICIIFAAKRHDVDIVQHAPGVLTGCRHHIYADDAQTPGRPDSLAVAHARAGLDPEDGGIVVVRPDGYIGAVVRLVRGSSTAGALNQYFSAISGSHVE
jgi:hypothetical protein